MIGETPLLEFKEQNPGVRQLTDEENQQLADYNKQAETKAEEILGKVLSGGDFAALAKQYSEDEKTKEASGDLGWVTTNDQPELVELAKKIPVGKTSTDLTTSGLGYEIIKLEGKRDKTDAFTNQPVQEVKA
ncbi:hypothetical protein COS21_00475, partial [bacterium (Candidatus Gribaldobacteria) CG02_land_8_20_14_3_00_41_15]